MQAKACLLIAPSLMCKGSLLYHPGRGVGGPHLGLEGKGRPPKWSRVKVGFTRLKVE